MNRPAAALPTLSIVTICLNDRAGLERTLASIFAQGWKDFELVVVDGGSSDGSVDVIRAHAARIATWVSERDGGVYDAHNKGAGLSRGRWVLYLNAGDHFASDDVLERFFAGAPEADILYGDVIYSRAGHESWVRPPSPLGIPYLMKSNLCTQATLIRRELIVRCGHFDLSLRICADYDLLMKALLSHGASSRHVPVTVAVHHLGGLSSRADSRDQVAAERLLIQQRYLPKLVRDLHDEYLAVRERTPARRLRALLRPAARLLRSLSRRLRRVQDDQ